MDILQKLEWLDRKSKADLWAWSIDYVHSYGLSKKSGYGATVDGEIVVDFADTFEAALTAIVDRIHEAEDYKYDERG